MLEVKIERNAVAPPWRETENCALFASSTSVGLDATVANPADVPVVTARLGLPPLPP